MIRIAFIASCFVIGGIVARIAQPFVRDNGDVTVVIVTTLTVLAGFMIAIITVLGDPASLPDGSFRIVTLRRDGIESKILRHATLFILYLAAIALLFVATIVKKASDEGNLPTIKYWIEFGFLFFSVSSFLLTFSLPFSLMKIQMERLKVEETRRREEVKQRRRDEGGSGLDVGDGELVDTEGGKARD